MDILNEISRKVEDYLGVEATEEIMSWPLMDRSHTFALITAYLIIIKYFGPRQMMYRKAFQLNTVIKVYNLIQIVSCFLIILKLSPIENTTKFGFSCEKIVPKRQIAYYFWWTMCLKLSEFLETIFFIMRKKQSQITNLHVYHHISTYFLMWYTTRYTPVALTAFYVQLNCGVHIIMYLYYLLSTTDNLKMIGLLNTAKKYITIIQMVQFTIALADAIQALMSNCPSRVRYKFNLIILFIPNVLLVYYMFIKFYRNKYSKEKR